MGISCDYYDGDFIVCRLGVVLLIDGYIIYVRSICVCVCVCVYTQSMAIYI